MKAEKFVNILYEISGVEFYAGVPDSQLKALCNYLYFTYGNDEHHHIIAANEGNCTGIAAGYHLSTGKIPVIYMQNSGEGNVINPVASLLNEKVYAIPAIFIIGWRGEPGIKDEPQHIFQGEVTLKLLEDMGIEFFVIRRDTSEEELVNQMKYFNKILSDGKNVAFVVCKDALSYDNKVTYSNHYSLSREEVLKSILSYAKEDPVVSTTGKISREIYEIRDNNIQDHSMDFLTIGSMGHCSSIALGIALNKPKTRIWCIDGDGAVLMHMGALALIGKYKPQNMIHVVINNGSHETVGGMPTAADQINIYEIAESCGYPYAVCVETMEDLNNVLEFISNKNELSMLEIKCSISSRSDLGRPKTSALENKKIFVEKLSSL